MSDSPKVDRIVRSKRRTMALYVRDDATVELRVPLRASEQLMKKFIAQNSGWITRHRQAALRKLRESPPKLFKVGEKFLYLGKLYPLAEAQQKEALRWDGKQFILKIGADGHKAFSSWYRDSARAVISERVNLYSRLHNLPYGSIRMTSARQRWGSCSPENNLSFAWRLVMLPLPSVDYLVAHELAHTRHKNHGKRFWSQVEKICPDFSARNRWLRDHGHRSSL